MDEGQDIRQSIEVRDTKTKVSTTNSEDFVLEKSIFNNVFEKDIRRVFIYKKAERLAKAIHLIAPAFLDSMSLKDRLDAVAVGLVDAAILPSSVARMSLSRELLTLSSILSIARSSGQLSAMNADLISRETRLLLQEVAEYEEPRVAFDETPTLSGIAKKAFSQVSSPKHVLAPTRPQNKKNPLSSTSSKGQIKDTFIKDRTDAILSVIRNKNVAGIKDISTIITDISEKTIQRELTELVAKGLVVKKGERRWSTYSLI